MFTRFFSNNTKCLSLGLLLLVLPNLGLAAGERKILKGIKLVSDSRTLMIFFHFSEVPVFNHYFIADSDGKLGKISVLLRHTVPDRRVREFSVSDLYLQALELGEDTGDDLRIHLELKGINDYIVSAISDNRLMLQLNKISIDKLVDKFWPVLLKMTMDEDESSKIYHLEFNQRVEITRGNSSDRFYISGTLPDNVVKALSTSFGVSQNRRGIELTAGNYAIPEVSFGNEERTDVTIRIAKKKRGYDPRNIKFKPWSLKHSLVTSLSGSSLLFGIAAIVSDRKADDEVSRYLLTTNQETQEKAERANGRWRIIEKVSWGLSAGCLMTAVLASILLPPDFEFAPAEQSFTINDQQDNYLLRFGMKWKF